MRQLMTIYGKYERLFWEKKCLGTFLQIDQAKSPKFNFEMINADVAIAIKIFRPTVRLPGLCSL